jgi:hypothetical protein
MDEAMEEEAGEEEEDGLLDDGNDEEEEGGLGRNTFGYTCEKFDEGGGGKETLRDEEDGECGLFGGLKG